MVEGSSKAGGPKPKGGSAGYLQIALIVGIIAVALFFARAPERVERVANVDQSVAAGKQAVRVLQPQMIEFALPIRLTGNVNLEERVTIVSEAKGRVAWVSPNFRNGGVIDANEVFVRIDPTEYQLQVKEAEILLELAQLRQASGEDLSASAATIELLQTRLDLARHKLSQTEISLPFRIYVIGSDVEVGEVVGPHEYVGREASVLGVGFRSEALQVSAPVQPEVLAKLDPVIGSAASVRAGNKVYKAMIDRVSAVIAPETRMRRIYLRFSEGLDFDALPSPGMFAEIVVDGPLHDNVYVLPPAAAQANGNVWIVRDGVLNSVSPVTLAHADDGWVVESFEAASGIVIGSIPGAIEGVAVTVAN